MLSLWLTDATRTLPAHALGYGSIENLSLTYRWSTQGGGVHQLGFDLPLPRRFTHPLLRPGARVQVRHGGVSLGWGVMSEPDREAWTFICDGMYRRAEHFTAEDASGAPTTNLRTAVVQANARGMGWNGYGNLPDLSVSTTSETDANLNTIAAVLTRYCENSNLRWGLDADNTPFLAPDPTTPSLALTPGSPVMATADDDYVSRVRVRFVKTQTSATPPAITYGTAVATATTAPLGVRETREDVTSEGPLGIDAATSQAAGQAYANAYLAANGPRLSFTQSIAPAFGQLTNGYGVPESLWLPKHGRLLRQFGVRDESGTVVDPSAALEWVVGEATYKPGDENPLTLTATALAPRTVVEIGTYTTRKNQEAFT